MVYLRVFGQIKEEKTAWWLGICFNIVELNDEE